MDQSFDLSSFSPDELDRLMELSGYPAKNDQLQQQIAQAQQLRQPQSSGHTTGIGAAMGGMGDVVRGLGGGMRTAQLQGQQGQNTDQQVALRKQFAQLLRGRQQPGADMNAPPDPNAEAMMNAPIMGAPPGGGAGGPLGY